METLPRAFRLRTRAEFTRVERKGKRVVGRHLYLLASPNDLPHPRVGLTVSRRVGNAVVRNLVKRRLRAIFRHNRAWFANGSDYVVIARASAAKVEYQELSDDVGNAARKSALVRAPAKSGPPSRG